ncbi:MAG: DMT family transporter [Burkholderiales bacterium]|nr:DMT family transporter [Burkholderiales bacterium]
MSPIALALVSILLWSTVAWLSLELARLPPFLLVGLCLLIGAACGLPRWRDWRSAGPGLLLLGVYGLFGFHFLLFTALRHAPAVEANLVNYLWPLLIVVLAPLIVPGTRLTARHLTAGALGFGGAALLATGGRFAVEAAHLFGYACALGSALIWSTYSLATRRLPAFPTGTVGAFCAVSGVLALACHALFEPGVALQPGDWPWLLALGVGPLGIAFYTWDAAMKRGDPRAIGTLAYLTPLLSTLWLAASGKGTLGWPAIVAMAAIVGGAALGAGGRGAARG